MILIYYWIICEILCSSIVSKKKTQKGIRIFFLVNKNMKNSDATIEEISTKRNSREEETTRNKRQKLIDPDENMNVEDFQKRTSTESESSDIFDAQELQLFEHHDLFRSFHQNNFAKAINTIEDGDLDLEYVSLYEAKGKKKRKRKNKF